MKTRIKVETKRNGEKTYYPQVFSSENIATTLAWSVIAFPFKILALLLSIVFFGKVWWYRHFEWAYLSTNYQIINALYIGFHKQDRFSSKTMEEAQECISTYINNKTIQKLKIKREEEEEKQQKIVKREYIKGQKILKTEYITTKEK